MRDKSDTRVIVMGAGVSGVLAGVKLQEAGFTNFTIYEKSTSVGGTWRDNTYPGLYCDVPSHLYCYSFELNPNWSRLYPPGPEIYEYLKHVSTKYKVDSFLQLGTEITRADFRDGRWHVETSRGTTDVCDILIAATGVLHVPRYPEIPGLETFQGAAFHSARWDHTVDCQGKRVAVLGGGSSGVQIFTALVDEAKHVTLFQRTPQWILQLDNPRYSDADKQAFRESKKLLQQTYKELHQKFDATFAQAVVGDSKEQKKILDTCRSSLGTIRDPALRAKLTPSYTVGCKRLIVSANFYTAVQEPNTTVVATGIERIEPTGIRDREGVLHACDVIVIATGFHAHQYMRPMAIHGRGGVSLADAWAAGNAAYRSVSIPEFPNLFLLLGPHSPIANHSVVDVVEYQIRYVMQLANLVASGQYKQVSASRPATETFQQALREQMPNTVWVMGCDSWYLDASGNPTVWPWGMQRFRNEMRRPDLQDFELVP